MAPHRPPTPTAPGWSGCARPTAYDWRTVRPFRGKEEAGHEEPWFAFLAGDDPGYPERILAAAQAQVRHRLRRMRALPRAGRARGRHPPVAAVQPRRHRGPGPADLGRPAGDLQRRPAAGPAALLRRRGPPRRPARRAWPPWSPPSTPRPPSSNWSTSTPRRRTHGDRPGRRLRRAHHHRPSATPPARTTPGSVTCTTTGTRRAGRHRVGADVRGALAGGAAARVHPRPAHPAARPARPAAVVPHPVRRRRLGGLTRKEIQCPAATAAVAAGPFPDARLSTAYRIVHFWLLAPLQLQIWSCVPLVVFRWGHRGICRRRG